jgi:hypothetical protein
MKYVLNGWPNKNTLSRNLKVYYNEQSYLSVHDGLLMRSSRLVIPASLRHDVLRYLHDGHQGVSKTKEAAAKVVWWPGLSNDVDIMVKTCTECSKHRRPRVEPMKGTPFPERPWSRVGADFFQHDGKTYLLAIDYYS